MGTLLLNPEDETPVILILCQWEVLMLNGIPTLSPYPRPIPLRSRQWNPYPWPLPSPPGPPPIKPTDNRQRPWPTIRPHGQFPGPECTWPREWCYNRMGLIMEPSMTNKIEHAKEFGIGNRQFDGIRTQFDGTGNRQCLNCPRSG